MTSTCDNFMRHNSKFKPPSARPDWTEADFPELAPLADLSALALNPAEAHGLYCGLLCGDQSGDQSQAQTRWLNEILPSAPPQTSHGDQSALQKAMNACRAGLIRLAEHTLARLHDPELGFAPLLPDSDHPLAERAEAVHDWSRGFLYGLGLSGCDPNRLNGSAREALEDLTELTRMDLDNLTDSEENEVALSDITEFLWVATLLIYEERSTH